jgi:hypothetical protein
MLARRQVAQPHAAKIAQRYRRRQAPVELIDHGLGQQYLPPVSCLHDPRCPVDGAAEKVVVASLDDPQVQPRAHAQRDMIVGGQASQRLLQRRGGVKRVQRVAESGVHPVPGHLYDNATVSLDRLP